MKRIFLSLFLLFVCFLFTLNIKKVNASTFKEIISATSLDGNNIKLLEDENKEYKILLNDTKALSLDVSKKEFYTISFSETTSYYFLYGSLKEDITKKNDKEYAILIRIPKTFDNFDLLIKEGRGYGSRFKDLYEFYNRDNFVVLYIDDALSISQSESNIYLMNDKLEIIDEARLELHEVTIKPYYNLIEVKCLDQDQSIRYINASFMTEDKEYDKYKEYIGMFRVCSNMLVNGQKTNIGDTFTMPGKYTFTLDGLNKKEILLIPRITGIENDKYYDDSIEYSISGGNIYLNDELSFNSGSLSNPGKYELKICGINGYIQVYNFVIKPKLFTNISDGGTLNIGDTLVFSGSAKLNNEVITSGKKIEKAGTYRFILFVDDLVFETIEFTVNEEVIPKKTRNVSLFIFLSLLIVTIGITVFFIIRENMRRRSN